MPVWLKEFPAFLCLDIRTPIDQAIAYLLTNGQEFFDVLSAALRFLLAMSAALIGFFPWWLLLLTVGGAAFYLTGRLLYALIYPFLLFTVGVIGLWALLCQTLSVVLVSVFLSLLLGVPAGILLSMNDKADFAARPILDAMQTMPSFVYLIPAVMLLGLGNVPAVIATTIYALPPVVRLTCHGIRQVDEEVVEAATAFGSTRWQLLSKVSLPQAKPTIMEGVNQTIMMAISMVVTCSMIGATGLGSEVIIGINRLEGGRGFAAGLAIVILAIVFDRLTRHAAAGKQQPGGEQYGR